MGDCAALARVADSLQLPSGGAGAGFGVRLPGARALRCFGGGGGGGGGLLAYSRARSSRSLSQSICFSVGC